MNVLRGGALFFAQLLMTPLFLILMVLCLPFGGNVVYRLAKGWCQAMLFIAWPLGIRYTVELEGPLPQSPAVILVKHASAWETFFMMMYFPRLAPVVKKELLSIPFFGWGLALCEPIAIDRSSPREALSEVERQGMDRLAKGRWISIFPEGTRVPAGYRGRYAASGAAIALKAKVPLIAVAHDAGFFWQRGLFQKHPGTIRVRISAPFDIASDETPHSLTRRVEAWIEGRLENWGHAPAQPYARASNRP